MNDPGINAPASTAEPTGRQRLELAILLVIGLLPFYINGLYNGPLAESNRAGFWAAEIAAWIVLPAALFLFGWWRGLFDRAGLGLTRQVCGRDWPGLLAVLLLLVPYLFFQVDMVIVHWAHKSLPQGWPHPTFHYSHVVPDPGPHTGGWRILAMLHLALTAGIVEELYYRAALGRLFREGWAGGIAYVILSTLVFAGAHWEGGLPNVVEATVVGLFAAVVYRITRNVWPLMIGHIAVDWYWIAGGT